MQTMAEDLDSLQRRQDEFVQSRDWAQFHTPKSIAMSLSVEAAELLDVFQWHDNLPATAYEDDPEIQAAVEDELADILIYALSMASAFQIDLGAATEQKLDKNTDRFDEQTAAEIRQELAQWQSNGDC